MKDYLNEKQEFIKAAHKIANYNLLKCSSGNLSFRVDDDIALLSKSGSWLADLEENEIAICKISTGEILNGVKPTVENVFHRGILNIRNDVNVVLHFQSPFATTLACGSKRHRDFNIIAEIPLYIGEISTVPYILPGSLQLAEAIIEDAKKSNLIIMKNHGMVTMGKDFKDAIQKAVFFELVCQIMLTSESQVNYLSEKDVADLIKHYKS